MEFIMAGTVTPPKIYHKEAKMRFISAKEGPPNIGSQSYTVQYFDEKGNMIIRSAGTKAWRNNNPGNMVHIGGFAARHGAIGNAGGMAIFPTEAIGRRALVDLLKSSNYVTLKIKDLPEKYDKNNAQEYRRMLLSILSKEEFDRLCNAIERIEGWEIGEENFIDRSYITGVHKKHGVIIEYLIDKGGKGSWITKEEALNLAAEGRLHAIIVHLKNGTIYLRPEYGNHSFARVA